MDQCSLPDSLFPWRDAFMVQVSQLDKAVSRYLEAHEVDSIRAACFYGAVAHQHQMRSSGEPYIFHPIAVAMILTEVQIDCETIIGAILHDVIEDTDVTYQDVLENFGVNVANIVDGVSKLTQIQFASKEEAKAENFRKMIMAMTKDIRVIMVKLADRLHNMRTLGALAPYKKRRIAKETLEIYATIASRLGMYVLQVELENLCFEALYPMRYKILTNVLFQRYQTHKNVLDNMQKKIKFQLEQHQIQTRLMTREKHAWSIYKKIREKGRLESVFDIFAIRILVHTVDECYRVLGLVHSLFKPIMDKFKDYIAIPKKNGYQSLHTIVFGVNALPVEIQIRTRGMHVIAEAGAAAHWRYKEQYNQLSHNRARTSQWLQNMTEMQNRIDTSQEFMETIKADLFRDEIYVFTPKGKIIELPRGGVVVDFAYAIHSDIGNQAVSAKVNRVLVSLNTRLENGQTVEITTSLNARPDPIWLNFVKTAKARSALRHYLNHLPREEAIIVGTSLLEQSLIQKNIHFQMQDNILNLLAIRLNYMHLDDLFVDIGMGKRPVMAVIELLLQLDQQSASLEGLLVKLVLIVQDQRGVIAKISTALSESGADIEHIKAKSIDDNQAKIYIKLFVHHRLHLANVLKKLRSLKSIKKLQRLA